MAESKGFAHITVTPDDDDDVVIQAGVVEDSAAGESGETAFEDAGEHEEAEAVEAVEGAESSAIGESSEAATEPSSVSSESPRASKAAKSVDDGYHETTLEDIQSTSMSTTQKVVIVVALLGIIAAVAWYVLAR